MEHSRWKLARERKATGGYAESPEVELDAREHRLSIALVKVAYEPPH
jgi:hypothetical protein